MRGTARCCGVGKLLEIANRGANGARQRIAGDSPTGATEVVTAGELTDAWSRQFPAEAAAELIPALRAPFVWQQAQHFFMPIGQAFDAGAATAGALSDVGQTHAIAPKLICAMSKTLA